MFISVIMMQTKRGNMHNSLGTAHGGGEALLQMKGYT